MIRNSRSLRKTCTLLRIVLIVLFLDRKIGGPAAARASRLITARCCYRARAASWCGGHVRLRSRVHKYAANLDDRRQVEAQSRRMPASLLLLEDSDSARMQADWIVVCLWRICLRSLLSKRLRLVCAKVDFLHLSEKFMSKFQQEPRYRSQGYQAAICTPSLGPLHEP